MRLQGARHIFGKKVDHFTIGGALQGDLGWLSVKSQKTLAKLNFYENLCRLPDGHLPTREFLHRRSQCMHVCVTFSYFMHCGQLLVFCGLQTSFIFGISPLESTPAKVLSLTKHKWELEVERLVRISDNTELFANFPRTHSGLHYASRGFYLEARSTFNNPNACASLKILPSAGSAAWQTQSKQC